MISSGPWRTRPRSSPQLYRGEKRLVFCDSKRLVEMLGADLRARGVTTHLVHASLSLDERRRAEQAFAEGRDCVIVSTSALELGVDVGDLDRVIQVNSPSTVAAFLQRLGRSGRRPGTTRNCLFLALDEDELLHAAGLLLAWSRGFVEQVAPPPEPRHIVAQQLLALCLQEKRVGQQLWQDWLALPELTDLRPADHGLPDRAGFRGPRGRDAVHRPRSRAPLRPAPLHGPDGGVHRPAGIHRPARQERDRPHRPGPAHRRG